MKNKWNILIWVFLILVLMYAVRGFLDEQMSLETVRNGTLEDSITGKGTVIKYEALYDSVGEGVVESQVKESARVSRGMKILSVYKGEVDPSVKNKLDQVNKRINVIKANESNHITFSNDVSKLESEMQNKVNEIIDTSYQKKLEKVSTLKHTIAVLSDRKAVVSGVKSASSNTLNELENTKNQLETQIGSAKKDIYASSTGVFSTYIDGLESLITPYNMDSLTPSKLAELQEFDKKQSENPKEEKSGYLCKIIDNFRYFIAVSVDADKLYPMKENDSVTLRFSELSNSSYNANVYSVSAVEDGKVVVILEGNRYLDSLLAKRTVEVDIVKKQFKGLKIPLAAIHTENEVKGVYIVSESIMRFVPIRILYNNAEIAIAESADEKKPFKLYDEIVLNASVYEDGKLVKR